MQLPNLFGSLLSRGNAAKKTEKSTTPMKDGSTARTTPVASIPARGNAATSPRSSPAGAATAPQFTATVPGRKGVYTFPSKAPAGPVRPAPSASEILTTAVQWHKQGHLDQAEVLYREVLKTMPDHADALQYLGMLNGQRGDIDKAIGYFEEALAAAPEHFAALSNLGTALLGRKRLAEALALFDRAASLQPGAARIWLNRGNALHGLGRADEACDSYRRALEIQPDYVDAHIELAAVLRARGRLEEAAAGFSRALALQPDYAELHANLAATLRDIGRLDDAAAGYRRALALKPDYPELHANLAAVLRDLGQLDEAAAAYRRAVEINPDFAEAHGNLGFVLREQGKFGEAEQSCRRALEIRPDYAKGYINLGATLQQRGKLDAAVACYRKALEVNPDLIEAHHPLLLNLNYLPDQSAAALLEQARQFGAAATRRAQAFTAWPNSPEVDRCLRVGFVSGDLRNHPVGYFIESVMKALAEQAAGRLECIVYATHLSGDAVTERIRSCCSAWISAVGLSDKALAQRIHEDRIDILIDLAGHSDHNRLPMFAWKPAPVQASWLGYFATTGLSEIDYLIADPWTLPATDEAHFTETVWRLPETRLCFTPPAESVAVAPLPALANGYLTFGCFNNLAKMNDAVVALWSRVLQAVPGSRLLLKAPQLIDEETKRSVAARFSGHGIGEDRLQMEGPSPRAAYLAAYGRIDIALDPFPFTGGTTSMESLWMGVPVLTLAGDRFISRQGVGLLMNAGLPDWVAADPEDYVARAVQHAADLTRLGELRQGLRQHVLHSPVFDATRFATHFEAALRGMWTRWCDRRQ
ncbi:MAG TPA: tetratricopeptide repeat protein [Noviherbaspirillum sp.]